MMQATGGPLKAGERALVTAAGGATGHMGVQLALLAGCHVVAVCGSEAKAKRLRDLGVHRVINYREEVMPTPELLTVGDAGPHQFLNPGSSTTTAKQCCVQQVGFFIVSREQGISACGRMLVRC